MSIGDSAASVSMVVVGALGGLLLGMVAVHLARTIPQRMDQEPRSRPQTWWAAAYVAGILYGALIAAALDNWAPLPAFLVFGAATLAITLIDLDHQLIPNRVLFPAITVAGLLLVIGVAIDGSWGALLRGILGSLSYFIWLLVVGLLARGGFGMGDVKLALLLGLFLGYVGWGALLVGAILAILLGGVASMLLLITRRGSRDAKFAYGPYLVIGSWLALVWAQDLIDWYVA